MPRDVVTDEPRGSRKKHKQSAAAAAAKPRTPKGRAANKGRHAGAKAPPVAIATPDKPRPPFEFEIDFRASDTPTISGRTVLLSARLRHRHDTPIALRPGAPDAFNVGIRVCHDGETALAFEDRMIAHDALIAPGAWSDLSVRVPVRAFGESGCARVTIDMLKGDGWFSPPDKPPVDAVISLKSGPAVPAGAPASPVQAGRAREREAETRQFVFDVSDLIHYFNEARLPTGIQRVQIEVIDSLLDRTPPDCTLAIACFRQQQDFWVDLPADFFRTLCALSLRGGERDDPVWTQALYKLTAYLAQRPSFAFEKGAFLVNLGTSWWLRNYFLNVRAAKAHHGIRSCRSCTTASRSSRPNTASSRSPATSSTGC